MLCSKQGLNFESYVYVLWDFSLRKSFAKLHLIAHNLQIESGKYGIKMSPREERYYLYYKPSDYYVVEDKVHFLVNCPLYRADRNKMLEAIYSRFPSIKLLNEQNFLIWLLSQPINSDVGSISNLGGGTTHFLKLKGQFLKIKRALLFSLQKFGAFAPCALPGAYVSAYKPLIRFQGYELNLLRYLNRLLLTLLLIKEYSISSHSSLNVRLNNIDAILIQTNASTFR